MIVLPWAQLSLTVFACAPAAATYLQKRHSMVARIVFIILVAAAWNTGRAQQPLQTLRHHVRPEITSGKAALFSAMPSDQVINATIVLPLRNPQALSSLLSRLYDPSSPDYRHFLTVAEFTQQFGPTLEDYQSVVSFCESQRLYGHRSARKSPCCAGQRHRCANRAGVQCADECLSTSDRESDILFA